MAHRRSRILFFSLLLTLSTLSLGADPAGEDSFPHYESIRDHVEFWQQVYAGWSLGQVAVHDLEHPGVIYEVVDLPGVIEERYSEEQIDFIEDLAERWADRLERLEQRVAAGRKLGRNEKEWALALTTFGGTDAVTGAHERVRTQRGLRERFRRGIELGSYYEPEIREIVIQAGLPIDLLYLPHVESSYQARARSSAGALGVWQFTRATGKRFLKINAAVDERLDAVAAARGAMDYLAAAYEKLGSWPIALTSYNHGVAGMARAVAQHGPDYEAIFEQYSGRLWGFASKNFYAEFLAAREIAQDPQRFFPEGLNPEPPRDVDSLMLEERTTVQRLAEAFDLAEDELVALNPAFSSRAVRSGYSLPTGLEVWLPAGTYSRLALQGREVDYGLGAGEVVAGEYTVRPGDTLSEIATAHGLSVSGLRELNGMKRGESLIRVGQRLRVNGSTATSAHVVQRGETLSEIARSYGMKISTLRALNGMQSGDSLIRSGQKLRVRGEAGDGVHVVRSGESLIRIAVRYGVELAELLLLNRLSKSSIIHPGQVLLIPSRG